MSKLFDMGSRSLIENDDSLSKSPENLDVAEFCGFRITFLCCCISLHRCYFDVVIDVS